MKLSTMNVESRLELAINTVDAEILNKLKRDQSMLVRRAVARNKATPQIVVNHLVFDQVANVSYQATKNPNCTITRKITEENHPCVNCNMPGNRMNCLTCVRLKDFLEAS